MPSFLKPTTETQRLASGPFGEENTALVANLRARVAELEADSRRLDTLERLLLDHPRGREFALKSDYEDGIWVAEALRGSLRTMPLEDPFKDQVAHKTLRAAIDAIALPAPAK